MKKISMMILSLITVVSLAACGNSNEQETSSNSQSEAQPETTEEPAETTGNAGETSTAGTASSGSDILVAYFTVPETDGTDTVAGASRVVMDGEVLGNTQYIAQLIQESLGTGDTFAIETAQAYPGSHDPLLEAAYEEKADDARPELSAQIENLDDYNTIFIGYPNWNADLPMPMYTFFEEHDFSGKTIILFNTHGGSGLSRTVDTIAELEPDATLIDDALSISRNSVPDAEAEVAQWVESLDLPANES